jgi:hypothetical protein
MAQHCNMRRTTRRAPGTAIACGPAAPGVPVRRVTVGHDTPGNVIEAGPMFQI